MSAYFSVRGYARAWHAVLIALALGASFTVVVLGFGPGLYRLLGGRDASLAYALEYSNIVFGLGATLVAMVGTNVGAGQIERARQIAWTGGFLAAAICGSIGAVVTIAPWLWAGMFTHDPGVLAITTQYFRIAGPSYAFLGLGMA